MRHGFKYGLQTSLTPWFVSSLPIQLFVKIGDEPHLYRLQFLAHLPGVGTGEVVRILPLGQHHAPHVHAGIEQHRNLCHGSMNAGLVIVIYQCHVLTQQSEALHLHAIQSRTAFAYHVADTVLCHRDYVKLPLYEKHLVIFRNLRPCLI